MAYRDLTAEWTPETAAWRELRFACRPRSLGDLWRASGMDLRELRELVRSWLGRGLVTASLPNLRNIIMADTARDMRDPPPRAHRPRRFQPHTARQRIWVAMRVLKRFELPSLLMAAGSAPDTTSDYLNQLVRAGYVRSTTGSGDIHRSFELVRDTGPRHPQMSRQSRPGKSIVRLTDPNTGERILIELAPKRLRDRRSPETAEASESPFFERSR